MCCVSCMYLLVWSCARVHACMWRWKGNIHCLSSVTSLFYFWDRTFCSDTHQFVWLSNELRVSVSFLPQPPMLGLQMPNFVCRFWRTALRASPLLGRLFTNWTIFPCPPFYFLRLGFTMLLKLPSTFGCTWSSCPTSPWLGLEASTAMLCTTMPLRSSFNVSFKR